MNNKFLNSKGQALTEYVLFLFVVLAIAFGVLYQFNSAFRVFAEGYFGDYLSCLLETGELPNLGTPNTNLQCDSAYEPFSLANGRPYQSKVAPPPNIEGPSLGQYDRTGSTRGASGGGSSSTPDAAPTATGDLVGGGQGEYSSGSSGYVGSQFVDLSQYDSGRTRNVPVNSADSSTRGDKKSSLETSSSDGSTQQQIGGAEEGRPRYFDAPEVAANDSNLRKRTIDIESTRSEDNANRIPAESEDKKVKGPGDDEGMTLPDFLRYLIIAGIIIAIVIFFGGQALQFSKSQE